MKTKTYIIILIAISCQTILLAQQFAPVGAEWNFSTYDINPFFGSVSYESIGDTIIDNKPCRIISKSSTTCYSLGGNHYLYESNDSIFRYDEELEIFTLSFILNAEVGDVWTIPVSPQLYLLDSMYCFVDSISYFHFNSTDSLRIQHVTLRVIDAINIDQNGDTTYYDSSPIEIYERIGFEIALFPYVFTTICDSDTEYEIRCYGDDEIGLIKFTEGDCYLSSTQELDANLKINIYPNPAKGHLIIQSDSGPVEQVEFFTLDGKIIKSMINVPPSIDLSSLENGFYMVKVYIKDKVVLKKIVIQN